MGYTLGQAAKAAGRSKTTVHRAIAGGRLSAARTENGGWSIDPAELARVFPADSSGNGLIERIRHLGAAGRGTGTGTGGPGPVPGACRGTGRNDSDLRTRLDDEAEERRKLTAILTGPQRSWWRRWGGWAVIGLSSHDPRRSCRRLCLAPL